MAHQPSASIAGQLDQIATICIRAREGGAARSPHGHRFGHVPATIDRAAIRGGVVVVVREAGPAGWHRSPPLMAPTGHSGMGAGGR